MERGERRREGGRNVGREEGGREGGRKEGCRRMKVGREGEAGWEEIAEMVLPAGF